MDIEQNQLVVQHNALVEAHYRLDPNEKKLVTTVVAMIKPDDKDFQIYELAVKDVISILKISGKGYYGRFRGYAKGILKKPLAIMKDDGGELFCNWFSSIEYLKGKGKIEFSFDPKLKPYLLELKEYYTSYQLKYALQLRGFYAMRLYELLIQYLRIGKRYFELEELKLKLGIDQGKYKIYNDLKKRIVDPAIKEIMTGSDIRVSYKPKKHVRRVIGLEFTIKKAWIVPDSILTLIPKDYRTDRRIISALDRNADRGESALKNIIEYVISQRPTHSFCGYLCYCLDKGYGVKGSKQRKLFEDEPVTPVFPGLQLQIGDKIMTVEEGNVLRFAEGTMPEGTIRQQIKEGTFVPTGIDAPPSIPDIAGIAG